MKHRTSLKLAASALALGITTVGCKPAVEGSRPQSSSQVRTLADQNAGKAAGAAIGASQKRNWTEAVAQAENTVSLSPRDAGYRTMLADIYLKSGRFESAASAYADALALNPGDSRTALSLALTQIGLGRPAAAVALLNRVGGVAPADHGLALALAGDSEGAIRMLSTAAREAGATARVRQNLALAYALAGDWSKARAIAAQDIAPDEVDARMQSWAEFAQAKGSYDQVATLLGVVPVLDSGQPSRLALNQASAEPVRVAAVEPVSVPAPIVEQADLVQATPEAVAIAQAEPPMAPDAEVQAEAAPVYAAITSVEQTLPQQIARPIARTLRAAATARTAFKGRYVIQLGAFASARHVEKAWNGAVGKLDRLSNYIPASTRIAQAGGGALTRLSVGGFADRTAAAKLCNSLRRAGGVCFVRATAGDAPVRWASRNTRAPRTRG